MAKMKKSLVLTALGVIGAIAVGGGVVYWLLNQRQLGGGELPVGVQVIPQDAFMTLSFSTRDDQWRQLRRLGTPESQAMLDQRLTEWRDRLLTANGLNYEEDVQPWVGDEITVALMAPQPLPIDSGMPEETPPENEQSAAEGLEPEGAATEDAPTNPAENEQSDLDPDLIDPTQDQLPVLFLPIADPLKAQTILTDVTGEGNAPTEREYKGLTIQSFETADTEGYEATVLDRQLLVVSPQAGAIEQIIDTYRGGDSVADAPGYRRAVRQLSVNQPFVRIYVNSDIAGAIAAANSTEETRTRNLDALQNTQGVAATVTLDPNGLTLQGTTWLSADSPPIEMTNQPRNGMADRLPAETLVVVSGSSLKTLWDGYSQRAAEASGGPFAPKSVREGVQGVLGLDLEEDVMAWMDDQFALALVSTNEQETVPSAGFVFMVEPSDPTLAKETLTRLDDVVENRYRFQVNETSEAGQEVVNWRSPFAALTITRGWLDNDVAFLAFNNATKTMLPRPSTPLAKTELFRQAMRSEMDAISGYFFINVEEFTKARDQLPVPDFPEDQAAIVGAIRAVGVQTSVESDRQLRYDISVIMPSTNE